jgi:hypothetical protein
VTQGDIIYHYKPSSWPEHSPIAGKYEEYTSQINECCHEMHVGTEHHSITVCFSEYICKYMLIVWENFDTKLFEHSTRATTVSGVNVNGFHCSYLVNDKLPANFIKIILISHEYLAALCIIILYTVLAQGNGYVVKKYSLNQMYFCMTS